MRPQREWALQRPTFFLHFHLQDLLECRGISQALSEIGVTAFGRLDLE